MSFLTRAATCAVLLVAGCTESNPYYLGEATGQDGGGLVGDLSLADFSTAGDLAGRDLATSPDLAQPTSMCSSSATRGCGSSGSLACVSGALVPDRTCPHASVCTAGYCAPPPSPQFGATVGRGCVFNNKPNPGACSSITNDASCQPFLDPTNPSGPVRWTCDTNVGAGGMGVACTSGATCSTGFCGSNGTCFMPCEGDASCFSVLGGNSWKCQGVSVVVEGRTLQTKSCIAK